LKFLGKGKRTSGNFKMGKRGEDREEKKMVGEKKSKGTIAEKELHKSREF